MIGIACIFLLLPKLFTIYVPVWHTTFFMRLYLLIYHYYTVLLIRQQPIMWAFIDRVYQDLEVTKFLTLEGQRDMKLTSLVTFLHRKSTIISPFLWSTLQRKYFVRDEYSTLWIFAVWQEKLVSWNEWWGCHNCLLHSYQCTHSHYCIASMLVVLLSQKICQVHLLLHCFL